MPADTDLIEDDGLIYSGEREVFDSVEVSKRAIEVGLWELEGCDGPPEELVTRIFRSMFLANGGAIKK